MIRPININLNAAHPELPLVEATTFTGAPSSVFIRGVPKAVGNWSITAVSVAVTYPDNTTTARAAVESAEGVWVATIPGTATSGRTAAGFKIMADGIDENGDAVTGYVLGFADFSVLSFTPVPAPGGTFWLLRYFDTVPSVLHKGDVAKIDGVLKLYNGSAWEAFAALDDAVTRTSANGVKSSGIWSAIWGALSALPTGFSSLYDWVVDQLAGKRDYNDLSYSEQVVAWPEEVSFPPGYTLPSGVTYRLGFDSAGVPSQIDFYDGDTIVGGGSFRSELEPDGLVRCIADQIGGEPQYTWPSYVTIKQARTTVNSKLMRDMSNGNYDTAQKILDAINSGLAGKLDKSGGTMTGAISFDDSMPSGGPCSVYYNTDQWHFKDHMGNEIVTPKFTGGTAALSSDIPYTLVTKTISNNAVTLDDRAINAVAVSSSLASLTVNFPTATNGKVRDFGLRLTVASGVTTAPQLVLPQGVTCENADGEAPEIGADGAATILYFTETAAGVFLVKGETVQTIS